MLVDCLRTEMLFLLIFCQCNNFIFLFESDNEITGALRASRASRPSRITSRVASRIAVACEAFAIACSNCF